MFWEKGQLYFIEAHGPQHFEHTGYETMSMMTLEDVQKNDRQKKALAIANGIAEENYIILDCRRSTLKYMKTSILASPLVNILELEDADIDWDSIFVNALSPLSKEILSYALEHPAMSTKKLAKVFGVNENYSAKVLKASGKYGKEERAKRKSKEFYENNRKNLYDQLRNLIVENSDITIAEIAHKLNRSKAGIYRMLREHEHDIDMNKLKENAERNRKKRAKERVCKKVVVLATDDNRYEFESLTSACKELEFRYNISFPISSVSRAIKENIKFRGFYLRYDGEDGIDE